MKAVEEDRDWELTARVDGRAIKTVKARELMHQIADAAWRCADPGVQYDTTINRWHTCPESGRINASNPCSRVHARRRLGLQPGVAEPDEVPQRGRDVRRRGLRARGRRRLPAPRRSSSGRRATRPRRSAATPAPSARSGSGTPTSARYLMADGVPYDSDEGRNVAAAITALMTGRAYRKSAEIAASIGAYDEYAKNREPHNQVMRMHRDAAYEIDPAGLKDDLLEAARRDLGRGGRARRGARLSQRAGDRARPHRHDQLPDGLRHDRDRARLLAGQVQGAGRRRPDDDRQPDRADGAADARLLRRRRSSRSRPTSTRRERSSTRPSSRTSTCRCSTWPSASGRSRTPATSR